MTDPKRTPDDLLTEHFRQHTHGEPPASLDAFILATAHREAPKPRPSLWQRWVRACQRPRWQMAFATVAGLALMIGVITRTPQPSLELSTAAYTTAPTELARPAPALTAPAPMARLAMAPPAESARVQADSASPPALSPTATLSKRAAVAPLRLEQGLQEIQRLRAAGQTRAADEKLLELHERFPDEDLPARLEGLQKR